MPWIARRLPACHFILKAASREKLNASLRRMLAFADGEKIPRTNVIVDVDALSLL